MQQRILIYEHNDKLTLLNYCQQEAMIYLKIPPRTVLPPDEQST